MSLLKDRLGIDLADLSPAQRAALQDAIETFGDVDDVDFLEVASRVLGRPELCPSLAQREAARERDERAGAELQAAQLAVWLEMWQTDELLRWACSPSQSSSASVRWSRPGVESRRPVSLWQVFAALLEARFGG